MSASDRLIGLHLLHLRRSDHRGDTIRHRESNLYRADRVLDGGLVAADQATLWAWQDGLREQGLAVASVRCYTSHVRAFFAWAVREGHIERDPTLDLKAPRVPRPRAAPIAEDRLRVALACAPDSATHPIKTWLVLAAYCGLRAGEISRLTRDAIGEETLDVDGKGGKARTVPLPPAVRTMLLAHVRGPGALWRHRAGRPLTPHDVSMDCSRHLRGTGAECSLHKLRHRYATRLFRLSKDPMLVRDLLGHASLSTTQVYLAVSAERGQQVAQRLATEGLEESRSVVRSISKRRARGADPAEPAGTRLGETA